MGYYWRSTQYLFSPIRVMFGTRLFSGLCLAFLGQGHNCYIAQLIYFCLPPSSKHSVYKIVSVGSLNNRFLKTKEILNVTPTLIGQRVPSKWVKTVSIWSGRCMKVYQPIPSGHFTLTPTSQMSPLPVRRTSRSRCTRWC